MHEDGVIIIDAIGTILMISQVRAPACACLPVRCCASSAHTCMQTQRHSPAPPPHPCMVHHTFLPAETHASRCTHPSCRVPAPAPLQGMTAMFGYSKIELENANVSMLMPQPFSQRHPSYLTRYVSSQDPHILDKVQEVVALHKVGARAGGWVGGLGEVGEWVWGDNFTCMCGTALCVSLNA